MRIQGGYDRSRAEYLTNNCKWANRYFKPITELKKVSTSIDISHGWSGKIRGWLPAHMINLNEHKPILFKEAFKKCWYSIETLNGKYVDGLVFMMEHYGEPDEPYIDIIASLFHESMFLEENFEEENIEIPKTVPAYRPHRPELSNFEAISYVNGSRWKDRRFKSLYLLEELCVNDQLPNNLWEAIATNYGDYCTLSKVLEKIMDTAATTWNGIISDLSWGETNGFFTQYMFDSWFYEEWFYHEEKPKSSISVQSKIIESTSVNLLSVSPKIKLINKNNEPQTLKIKSNVKIRN